MFSNTRINPVLTSEEIQENYLNFLSASFSLKNSELAAQFKEKVKDSQHLFKGPILQANPHYRSGQTLRELAQNPQSGVSREFLNLAPGLSAEQQARAIPIDRPLYIHQQKALQAVAQGKNVIVATGTGSGKTESFLFPIINHLLQERTAQGRLSPGVRALLIYPMNALANDQIKRLREMLPPESQITFGRYTGQTKTTSKDALTSFESENGRSPQSNELISREQIQASPPHILLTNYAMLEYLLMRPEDAEIFNHGETWKFLVLDEAHTYKGAMGTEIGYLMKKVKERVAQEQGEHIQCIATSATIGNDSADHAIGHKVCKTVENLFGSPFEPENLIFAEKVPTVERFSSSSWGNASPAYYHKIYAALQNAAANPQQNFDNLLTQLSEMTEQKGFPDAEVLDEALNTLSNAQNTESITADMLFELLKGDQRIRDLALLLEAEPWDLSELSHQLFADESEEPDQTVLVQLIDLATNARDPETEIPLLMARYHFFVKAMEGLSIAFPGLESQELMIGRFSEYPQGGIKAFELKGCKRCGTLFLNGKHQEVNGHRYFQSYPEKKNLLDIQQTEQDLDIVYTLETKNLVSPSEDEDALADNTTAGPQEAQGGSINLSAPKQLCVHCGKVYREANDTCDCKVPRRLSVQQVLHEGQGHHRLIKTCPACGGKERRDSIIHSFRTPENAAAFMLGRTLFQHVPPTAEKTEAQIEPEIANPFAAFAPQQSVQTSVRGKRRLLAFSDSRRDAAYFAAYTELQASKILHRQLIYSALRELEEANPNQRGFSPDELCHKVATKALQAEVFQLINQTAKQEVANWIYAELCSIQPRQSLEGCGLIQWRLHPQVLEALEAMYDQAASLFDPFDLKREEVLLLLEQSLIYLRKRSVVGLVQAQTDYTDNYFWPRNRPYSMRMVGSDRQWSVTSWLPNGNRDNGRTEYFKRLWARCGQDYTPERARDLLGKVFQLCQIIQDPLPIWKNKPLGHLWGDNAAGAGAAEQINPAVWVASSHPQSGWFRCDSCGNLSTINQHSLCPTYRCQGRLEAIIADVELEHHYYRNLYLSDKQFAIHIAEHTAQLTVEAGADRQARFIGDQDPLNMLSCSTTFELGVDVGQLHAVFMRNVPPGIANYVQRAGRAARRLDATAYILTFCRARSHDLAYFDHAETLVSGHVSPPSIPENNLNIARRHLHSVVLEQFLKAHPEMHKSPDMQDIQERGRVRTLFFTAPGADICTRLYHWLQERPVQLQNTLKRIFSAMDHDFDLENWLWVQELVKPVEPEETDTQDLETIDEEALPFLNWGGILGQAQAELYSEYLEYQRMRANPRSVMRAEQQIERIKSMYMLDYLPARGVLPKYGFPVDVVQLKLHSMEDWARDIRLERDLSLAISEFAPGSQLIANNQVITSYGLQKVMGKRWPEYNFQVCRSCGRFQRSASSEVSLEDACTCNHYRSFQAGRFIIPKFGFTTSIAQKVEKPVELPPRKTFATQVFFSSYDLREEPKPQPCGPQDRTLNLNTVFSSHGKLVLINTNNRQMFSICRSCGFGSTTPPNSNTHDTPFGTTCINTKGYSKLALGHEFKTDVLELRFSGAALGHYKGEDVWHSILAAVVRGCCQALDIEEENLDGTLGNFAGGNYRSLILYDTFPGGAGLVKQIADYLPEVIQSALDIAQNCHSCSESQSCNACLRRYKNQYAHELLKRGVAATFLSELYDTLFAEQENDGFRPHGFASSRSWLEDKLRNSQSSTLVLKHFYTYADQKLDWLKSLRNAAINGRQTHLLLGDPDNLLFSNPESPHFDTFLGLLTVGVQIHTFKPDALQPLPFQACFENSQRCTLARWPEPENQPKDAPFHVLHDKSLYQKSIAVTAPEIQSWKKQLNALPAQNWNIESIFQRLTQDQNIHYIRLNRNMQVNWHDLLWDILPDNIQAAKIYDRYIRHNEMFDSIHNFLSMLESKAKQNEQEISIDIYTSYGENKNKEHEDPRKHRHTENTKRMQDQFFSQLRQAGYHQLCFRDLKRHHLDDIRKSDHDFHVPHMRYVLLQTAAGDYKIKIEKGFDILKQRHGHFLVTEDSYILVIKETASEQQSGHISGAKKRF